MPQPPHDPAPPDVETPMDALAAAEMECALAALPLREPSAALDARVAAALADAEAPAPTEPALESNAPSTLPFRGATPRRSRWLTGLAVAAVVALLAAVGLTAYFQPGGWSMPDQPDVAGADPIDPDAARPGPLPGGAAEVVRAGYKFQEEPVELRWTRDLDAGVLTAENAQPVRAVRRQDVEQRVWVDPERGVTVQITRPRERLMVVKQPTF